MTTWYMVILWDAKRSQWVRPMVFSERSGWYFRVWNQRKNAEAFMRFEQHKHPLGEHPEYRIVEIPIPPPPEPSTVRLVEHVHDSIVIDTDKLRNHEDTEG